MPKKKKASQLFHQYFEAGWILNRYFVPSFFRKSLNYLSNSVRMKETPFLSLMMIDKVKEKVKGDSK